MRAWTSAGTPGANSDDAAVGGLELVDTLTGELHAVGHTRLVVDLHDVVPNGMLTDIEPGPDFRVAKPFDDQGNYFPLPRGEFRQNCRRLPGGELFGTPFEALKNKSDLVGTGPNPAFVDLSNTFREHAEGLVTGDHPPGATAKGFQNMRLLEDVR